MSHHWAREQSCIKEAARRLAKMKRTRPNLADLAYHLHRTADCPLVSLFGSGRLPE